MKLIIILALVAAAIAYEGAIDNINVEELLTNDRLLISYIHCFLEGVKCTPEGKEISQWMPEAIENTCAKCTEDQKIKIAKVMNAIEVRHKPDYEALRKKYDPENKNQENLVKFREKYGH